MVSIIVVCTLIFFCPIRPYLKSEGFRLKEKTRANGTIVFKYRLKTNCTKPVGFTGTKNWKPYDVNNPNPNNDKAVSTYPDYYEKCTDLNSMSDKEIRC